MRLSVFLIAVLRGWKIHQLDIHNVFLSGVLAEEVYMKQPPGFVDSTLPSYVCQLHKPFMFKTGPTSMEHSSE
jgi:hypothetical protein